MADGNRSFDFGRELVVDLFAGAGGASAGIEDEYRAPDVAVNHNPIAIAVHKANHPNTRHYMADVFEVDPLEATGGQPVGILWASPDCRHHSKAAGRKPRSRKIRGLAWVMVRWAYVTRPRMIFMENVEEFREWGPLGEDDMPLKALRGRTFEAFRAVMTTGLPADHPDMPEILAAIGAHVPKAALVRGLGYKADFRELVAANYKTPTIRKRLYGVMRCDGRPIVWPEAEAFKQAPTPEKRWRWAAECIDFTDLGKSIFERRKPLADASQRRIARGCWRHVLTAAKPFIVPQSGSVVAPILTEFANASSQRTFRVDEALRTQVAQVKGGHFALAAAHLVTNTTGHSGASMMSPTPTVATGGHHALAASHIVKFRGDSIGHAMDGPMPTVTAGGDMARPAGAAHALGMASMFLEQANGGFYDGAGRSLREPVSTIVGSGSQQRLVSAYLVKYYRDGGQLQGLDEPMHTLPTKGRMGLVQVVQVPADLLPPELMAKAKRCADFLHRWLPEHFPESADLVLVGDHVLVDITLRMLQPKELKRAQGFRPSYILDRGLFFNQATGQEEWRPITKTDQVKLIGNSVCRQVAAALVRANAADLIDLYHRIAA
ncbi:MAG: DNA cytosine methyltransferase [Rhodanobacter sp.]|jgi:DNA (cytosine-5)-methyltransferase 1